MSLPRLPAYCGEHSPDTTPHPYWLCVGVTGEYLATVYWAQPDPYNLDHWPLAILGPEQDSTTYWDLRAWDYQTDYLLDHCDLFTPKPRPQTKNDRNWIL